MTNSGTTNEAVRDEWLKKTLEALPPGLKVLDAGAGEQNNKKFCAHLQYVSQDSSQYDGQGDGKGLQTGTWDTSKLDIISDIIKIPEPDASYDVILCTEVLEHLPEPVLVFKEFRRLLKNDGVLILTAPFCSLTHLAPYHYYTGYNKYFYEKFLPEHGFEIVELTANGNFFEYLIQELNRIPSIAKDFTSKKPGQFFLFLIKGVINYLRNFSSLDKGSSEVLCFGYHLKAVKRKNE